MATIAVGTAFVPFANNEDVRNKAELRKTVADVDGKRTIKMYLRFKKN